jgi:DNA-binding CsgD family transcriptional regulator
MAEADEGILGRDAELAEVAAFTRAVPDGPTALILEGIAGIGKTTLWLAGVTAARTRGCRVLSSRGAEAEATLSYTGLGDLLEGVFDEILPGLPSPQRRALDAALLRTEMEGSIPDQRAVSLACVGALRSIAASGPLVIAIDDVQWLDLPSAHVLSFALRRLSEEPVGVMVSRRVSSGSDGDPLGIERAIPAPRVRRLRVGPLSVGALGRLLRARTGADLTRPVAGRLHRISGGNPFFALEMARAMVRHGARLEPGAPLPVPEDLQQLLGSRLATLPRSARDTLLVVAAVARPSEDLVLAAADGGDHTTTGLASAEAAGIIERTGGRIRFSHPLFGSAVYRSASPRRRRALHLRLAKLVTDPEEHARHLALAASGPDLEVARALDEAASHSRARGAPDAAADLAELARQLTPPEEVDAIRRRSIEAAEYHFDAGDATRAEALLDEAIATSPPGAERARILYRRASISWMNLARVAPLLEQARVEAPNEPELLAGIHQDLAWVAFYQGDLASASHHAGEAALHAERLVDPAIRGDVLSTLGMVAVLSGRPTLDAMSEAVRFQDLWMREGSWTEASVYTTPRACLGLQLMWAGQLDAARTAFEYELTEYEKHAAYTVRQEVLCYLAELECRAGRWRIAVGYADEAGDILAETGHMEGGSSLVHFTRALAAAHVGEVEIARREAAEGAKLALSNDDPFFGNCCRAVLGFVELSLSNYEQAHEHLEPAVRYLERMGAEEPGVIPCVPDDIEALVALGRLGEAEALLEHLEEQGRALDRPWALATAARCRGLLLAARGDLTQARSALARSLVEHERVPQPFELARTLLVAGEVERRARQKRSARSFLERALAGFDQLGVARWSARASAALDRVGGAAAARAELTPTEQRVADLVAEGKTNREVADALFVTVKTVEANLSRIFHKLGLRSRAELIRAMAVAPSPGARARHDSPDA